MNSASFHQLHQILLIDKRFVVVSALSSKHDEVFRELGLIDRVAGRHAANSEPHKIPALKQVNHVATFVLDDTLSAMSIQMCCAYLRLADGKQCVQ